MRLEVTDHIPWHNPLNVVDGQTGVRTMSMGNLHQSAVRLINGQPDQLQPPVFEYERCLDLALKYRPGAKKFLFLGFGVGTTVSRIASLVEDAEIFAVDIEPSALDVAKNSFGFKYDINMIVDDARAYINKCSELFDIVFIDISCNDIIPTWSYANEFLVAVKDLLTIDGLVCTNITEIPDSIAVNSYINLFSNVHIYPINNTPGRINFEDTTLNTVLFSSMGELKYNLNEVDTVMRRILRDRELYISKKALDMTDTK